MRKSFVIHPTNRTLDHSPQNMISFQGPHLKKGISIYLVPQARNLGMTPDSSLSSTTSIKFFLKIKIYFLSPGCVAWLECYPIYQKVVGSISGQAHTWSGGSIISWGVWGSKPINDSLSHLFISLSNNKKKNIILCEDKKKSTS